MAATASSSVPIWFEWDDYLLDILLFGWFGWAVVIIFIVNTVLTFFGPLQPRVHSTWDRKDVVGGGSKTPVVAGVESCNWLNTGLNWIYLHYDRFPEFVDIWVKALNEQVSKLGVSMRCHQWSDGLFTCYAWVHNHVRSILSMATQLALHTTVYI